MHMNATTIMIWLIWFNCILCDYQCWTRFLIAFKIRFHSSVVIYIFFSPTNEVDCFCSPVFQPHLIISFPEMASCCLPFLPIIYKSVFGQYIALLLQLPLTSTQDEGTFKILQFVSAWALCHTDTFVIITVQRDHIGQERGKPHFSQICPGWQNKFVSIKAWTCTL